MRFLDIQLRNLLFVGVLFSFGHIIYNLRLCSITWLVLDLGSWTRTLSLICTFKLVVGQ